MSADTLPPPRDPGAPYRIALVCLGNICRSPIAHVVLREALTRAGLNEQVYVDSSGTGDWHLGHPMDPRAATALTAGGYDGSQHRARQFTRRWFDEHDLLLAMDHSNFRDITAMAPDDTAEERVQMFRAFDPQSGPDDLEVPDPYYDGDDRFSEVLTIVERTADSLVRRLRNRLSAHTDD